MKALFSRKNILIGLAIVGIPIVALICYIVITILMKPEPYHGGVAPDGTYCEYGYNYVSEGCCDEDDYSCEVRDRAPKGATAYCNDGKYSFSHDKSLACSNHDGINEDMQFGLPFTGDPLGALARCQDGSYSYSVRNIGSCSGHGGVERWMR